MVNAEDSEDMIEEIGVIGDHPEQKRLDRIQAHF